MPRVPCYYKEMGRAIPLGPMKKAFIFIREHLESVARLAHSRGHTYWAAPLCPDSQVVDLGANRGEFSRGIMQKHGCRIFAVEPNPLISIDPDVDKHTDRWAIIDHDGLTPFFISHNPQSGSVSDQMAENYGIEKQLEVRGITLQSFLEEKKLSHVDLLKMDVEGAEIPILSQTDDDTLQKVDQLSVEFHDFRDDRKTPHVRTAIRRLRRLGYMVINANQPYHDNVLFIRGSILRRHPLQWTAVRVLQALHYLRGQYYRLAYRPTERPI